MRQGTRVGGGGSRGNGGVDDGGACGFVKKESIGKEGEREGEVGNYGSKLVERRL